MLQRANRQAVSVQVQNRFLIGHIDILNNEIVEKHHSTAIEKRDLGSLQIAVFRTDNRIAPVCRRNAEAPPNSEVGQLRAWHRRQSAEIALLTGSDKNVDMIAHECGFASTSYLSLRTKESYGATPLRIRRSFLLKSADKPRAYLPKK